MDPQAELLKLSSIEPRVYLQPVWSYEARSDEYDHNKAEAQRDIARQSPLPVGVGVWEQVISHPHPELLYLHCLVHSQRWDIFTRWR